MGKYTEDVRYRRSSVVISYAIRTLSLVVFIFLWKEAVDWNLLWPLQFGNLPKPFDVITEWISYFRQLHYYKDIGVSTLRVTTGIVLGLVTCSAAWTLDWS